MTLHEGRLPTSRTKISPLVHGALRIYRRLWADGAPRLSIDRRRILAAFLMVRMERMSRQELADYYARVRLVP